MAGRYKTSKTSEAAWNYDIGIKSNKAELKKLSDIAKKKGLNVPSTKEKISLLDKVFGFLSAAETAPAVYEYLGSGDVGKAAQAQGKATAEGLTLQGYGEKKTYEDVLTERLGMKEGIGSKVAGFAGDVLLDPTTYFGGFLAKGAKKVLGKAGAKVGKVATKLPVVGPVAEGLGKSADELAGLFSKTRRVMKGGTSKKEAEAYLKLRNELLKEGRYTEGQMGEMLNKLVTGTVKKEGKGVGKAIGEAIEEPSNVDDFWRKALEERDITGTLPSDNILFHVSPTEQVGKLKARPYGKETKPVVWLQKGQPQLNTDGYLYAVDPSKVKVRPSVDGGSLVHEGEIAEEAVTPLGKLSGEGLTIKELNKRLFLSKNTSLGPEATKAKAFMQGTLADQLAKETARGIEVGQRSNYLPRTLTDKAREFLGKTGYNVPGLNSNPGFAKGRKMEKTMAESNKEFRAWLTQKGMEPFNLFEEDAFKAFGTRMKAGNKALTAKQLRDTVADRFGLPDDLMKETVGPGFFSDRVNVIDGVRYVPMTANLPTEVGGEIIKLSKDSKSWVPEGMVRDLQEINKVFVNDDATAAVLKLYDKVLTKFKGSVTALFPSFHLNNFKGGIFNNWLAGVNNPERYVEARKLLGGGSEDVLKTKNFSGTYKYLVDTLSKRGAINAGGYVDVFGEVTRATQRAAQRGGRLKGALSGGSMKVMNQIETINRGSLALDVLRKGGTIDDAVKKIFKYQFDYMPEAFTPFERNVMRRLIPFYTWSRNNIPLMLEASVKQPGKISAVGKAARDISNVTPEERANMPQYMKESFPVKLGEQIFYGANLPIEDINRLNLKGLMSSTAPMVKYPIEKYTGKNFFFDQPIEDYKKAPSWFKHMPKPIKDFYGYTERKGAKGQTVAEIDPYKYHFLTTALGRYVFTADKLADPKTTDVIKSLYAFLGVKGTDFDPKEMEYYATKDQLEKLGEFLKKKGAVKEFTRMYEPKK